MTTFSRAGRTSLVACTLAIAAASPHVAQAFCGFYVAGSNEKLFNDATQVVLMRDGTRTVLAMQNNYKGPPEGFAMVIPVPAVLHEGDVKTLPKELFAHVDQMGAPRLVEYWEQDPCAIPRDETGKDKGGAGAAPIPQVEMKPADDLGVKIEAKFVVGEYQIVILSAKDSTGLETWLHNEKYQIPDGAEPLLRPYVESGMKFFVAKVDPKKVQFVDGRAALSPLRFHYDSDDFTLPIRLGLASSSGTQDLIVNIIAPNQRYEVANYPNVTIPTNLDVKQDVRKRFPEFYAALFDRTIETNPGAVVTEYAWDASTCDPCPGPPLDGNDFQTLGGDVANPGATGNLVLTRLHARYGKEGVPKDLVFRAAPPIVGGREQQGPTGQLEERARPDSINNFQARYAIRHVWTGPMACSHPKRGVWGGPPDGSQIANAGPQAATNIAFAPRGQVSLPSLVAQDVPEIKIKANDPMPRGAAFTNRGQGCACSASGGETFTTAAGGSLLALLTIVTLRRRRRT